MPLAPADIAKRAAAARALEMVEDGMTLGLGTGSTAGWFVRLLSERIARDRPDGRRASRPRARRSGSPRSSACRCAGLDDGRARST